MKIPNILTIKFFEDLEALLAEHNLQLINIRDVGEDISSDTPLHEKWKMGWFNIELQGHILIYEDDKIKLTPTKEITLSQRDWNKMLDCSENPPEPSEEFKKLFKEHVEKYHKDEDKQ